jgi:hypothetical protein
MRLNERGVCVVLVLGALITASIIYFLHQYPLALSMSVIPAFGTVYIADTRYQPQKRNKK